MSHVEWDSIASGNKSFNSNKPKGSAGKFLKLEANGQYLLRPVHRPIKFYKFYNKLETGFRSAICDNPETCTIMAKYPDMKPSRRYAILVLDRNDDNKLKILEGPHAIFEGFKKYWDITKQEPGGAEGGDFAISVICPTGKKDRKTEYKVDFQAKTIFTADERKMLSEAKDSGEFNLPEIFKSHSDEEIEKRLYDPNWPPKKEDSSAGAASGTTAAAASDDDAFSW